jgi:hypothetical protein
MVVNLFFRFMVDPFSIVVDGIYFFGHDFLVNYRSPRRADGAKMVPLYDQSAVRPWCHG